MIQMPISYRGQSLSEKALVLVMSGAIVMLFLAGCQAQDSGNEGVDRPSAYKSRSPLEVVNLRMEAYNKHDLDAFLSTYAEEVEIFTYPDKSLRKGKKGIKSLFEEMFQDSSLQVEVHHQLAKDSYVVNHETVSSKEGKTEYVSIYEVREGLIESVRFVRD